MDVFSNETEVQSIHPLSACRTVSHSAHDINYTINRVCADCPDKIWKRRGLFSLPENLKAAEVFEKINILRGVLFNCLKEDGNPGCFLIGRLHPSKAPYLGYNIIKKH